MALDDFCKRVSVFLLRRVAVVFPKRTAGRFVKQKSCLVFALARLYRFGGIRCLRSLRYLSLLLLSFGERIVGFGDFCRVFNQFQRLVIGLSCREERESNFVHLVHFIVL